MATNQFFNQETILRDHGKISTLKSLIETSFYSNNVEELTTIEQVYEKAKAAPNVIVLDQDVKHARELDLPEDAQVLLVNDAITGRTASARRLLGENPAEDKILSKIVQKAIRQASFRPFYKSSAYVGLDEDFMMKAHITMPQSEVINLYSWLINFQPLNAEYNERYKNSKQYDENDIYIFFDPDWRDERYPDGLAYFDSDYNAAIILGMSYFGEIKKGTLTFAWGAANRNNFAACHGGLKEFRSDTVPSHVAAFFGLSGSGKSTLTHAKHNGKYDIKVLHDDAFIISEEDRSSVALEPSYFDKTNDYPYGHEEQDYFVTVQNVGVTLNEDQKKVMVTEDIRNGNGRTVKSRYSTPNRVDKIAEPIDSIYWIVKDNAFPPLVKVNSSLLASVFGLSLATKRSSAENVKGDLNALVIEPYANPFALYPLKEDYAKFKRLFEDGVDCYMINTGDFLGKDIGAKTTLGAIEAVVDGTGDFKDFDLIEGFQYLAIDGYEVDFNDPEYRDLLISRLQIRLNYINDYNAEAADNKLPDEIAQSLEELINKLS